MTQIYYKNLPKLQSTPHIIKSYRGPWTTKRPLPPPERVADTSNLKFNQNFHKLCRDFATLFRSKYFS